ncbi:hypothetical protein UR09_00775 [Candidatus Nitromaritima sp. SCGC AAA799-A02]|nr:hypothetical protein UR09_00775 [Candidatus Nitromaritima sp. SCGC AAA799-A02]
MNKNYFAVILLTAFVLSGCASNTGWVPAVDSYGDPNASRIEADKAECLQLAQDASGGSSYDAGRQAVIGGAIGAAAGAAIGAASGSAGTGAAIGAAVGGAGLGGKALLEDSEEYRQVVRNCMAKRGHEVVN